MTRRSIPALSSLCVILIAGAVWTGGCGGGGGFSFSGTVVREISGQPAATEPIADARVVVGGVLTQTDASGKFSASNPAKNTDGTVQVSVSKVGYRSFDRAFDVSSSPEIRLSARDLTEYGTVTGVVKDATTNAPVALAELEVQPIFGGEVTPPDEVQFAHTASDGSFQVTGFLGGNGRIICRAPGYLTQELPISIEVGDPPPPAKPYTILLTPTTERVDVQGMVTNLETGTPLEGIVVTLGDVNATTQADGSFTVVGVVVGTQTITINAQGYDPYSAQVTVSADMDTLRIALSRSLPPPSAPANVRGTVTLAGQESGAGATIVALDADQSQIDRATTDSAGTYGLFLPPGTYTIRASAQGFTSQERQVTVPGLGQVLTGIDFSLVQ